MQPLPQKSIVEVDIRVSAEINISALAARQKVNSFVISEISYMMHAETPVLMLDQTMCWRVPIVLSLTSIGDVGEVGAIDVDVQTGQMKITPQLIASIESRADHLAKRSADSYFPYRSSLRARKINLICVPINGKNCRI